MLRKQLTKIRQIKENRLSHKEKVTLLSSKLSTYISEEEMQIMHDEDMPITVGEYEIWAAQRPWNDWKLQLEITPIESKDYGFSNTKDPVFKEPGWYYNMQGTATVIYPPNDVINKVIDICEGKTTIH